VETRNAACCSGNASSDIRPLAWAALAEIPASTFELR
jgi:hypothetical protein